MGIGLAGARSGGKRERPAAVLVVPGGGTGVASKSVMSLRHQLEEAADRLEVASARVAELRARRSIPDDTLEWLEALSEMVLALGDIQSLANESVHEKLHAIASRLGVEDAL